MTTLLAIVFWLVLYMLPTILAAIRRKPDIGMIAFMNALSGWTVLGWFVALVMALWKVDREKYRMQH